jgi:hypothetical protein
MGLPVRLVLASSALFAATGLGYILAPGWMLSVVGVASAATSDFLLRTEGVALLCGAGVLWAVRDARPAQMTVALLSLAVYYILGSLVDLAAFAQGIVGMASVPSAAVRIGLGGMCVLAALRLSGRATTG